MKWRIDAGVNLLIARGYTGQTTENFDFQTVQEVVGIRIPSYASFALTYPVRAIDTVAPGAYAISRSQQVLTRREKATSRTEKYYGHGSSVSGEMICIPPLRSSVPQAKHLHLQAFMRSIVGYRGAVLQLSFSSPAHGAIVPRSMF